MRQDNKEFFARGLVSTEIVVSSGNNMTTKVSKDFERTPRRPATGGYPNGDATRLRIMTAATEIFGSRGYLGASTREIAAEANVNTPALRYYFGSKPELFTACVETVTDLIWQRLGPLVEDAEDCTRRHADPEALIACYLRVQDGMIDSFFAPSEGRSVRLLTTDSAAAVPGGARSLVESRLGRPLFRARAGIVGRIIGRPPDTEQTRLTTFAVNGLIVPFHLNHGTVVEYLGWELGDAAKARTVKPVLREQARLLLESMARAHGTWREANNPERLETRSGPKTKIKRQRTPVRAV